MSETSSKRARPAGLWWGSKHVHRALCNPYDHPACPPPAAKTYLQDPQSVFDLKVRCDDVAAQLEEALQGVAAEGQADLDASDLRVPLVMEALHKRPPVAPKRRTSAPHCAPPAPVAGDPAAPPGPSATAAPPPQPSDAPSDAGSTPANAAAASAAGARVAGSVAAAAAPAPPLARASASAAAPASPAACAAHAPDAAPSGAALAPSAEEGAPPPSPAHHASWVDLVLRPAGGDPLGWGRGASAAALQSLHALREARAEGLQFRHGHAANAPRPQPQAPPGPGASRAGGGEAAEAPAEAGAGAVLDPDELLVSVAVSAPLQQERRGGEVGGAPLLATLQLPASCTLGDLCAAIPCPVRGTLQAAGLPDPGWYLWLGDTFYVADEAAVGGAGDATRAVRDFCARRGLAAPPQLRRRERGDTGARRAAPAAARPAPAGGASAAAPPALQYTLTAGEAALEDVALPLGTAAGALFVHHGCCEHALAFVDARRVAAPDPRAAAAYPRVTHAARAELARPCACCAKRSAAKLVVGHPAAPADPALMCDTCVELLVGSGGEEDAAVAGSDGGDAPWRVLSFTCGAGAG